MTPGTQTAELPSDIRRQLWDVRSFAFDHLDAAAAVLDGSGVIVDTNGAWRLFADLNGGTPARTGVGVDYLQVCDRAAASGADDAARVARGLREILEGERSQFELEYPCRSPTEDRWFLIQAFTAPAAHGRRVLVTHEDITARRQLECRLADGGEFDELTGLPNRRSVLALLDEQLGFAGPYDAPVSVLCMAMEGLEEIRASSGHHLGDILLTKVAARLCLSIRTGDAIARISGTEFVLVCPGQHETAAHATASRLAAVITAPFQIGSRQFSLDVSIGVATTRDGGSAEALLETAVTETHRRRQELRGGHVSPVRHPPAGARGAGCALGFPGRDCPGLFSDMAADAMLEASLSHSSDVALFQRADGTIVWASPTTQSVFGIDPSDLIGLDGAELVHPEDRENALEAFRGIGGRGESNRFQFRIVKPDGDVRWVEEVATNLLDEAGVGVIVCNLRDITVRWVAEESDRFRARLLAAVGEAVIAIDGDLSVVYWNTAAEETYGWSASEALGGSLRDLLVPAPVDSERFGELMEHLENTKEWSGTLRMGHPDGGTRPVQVTHRPVFDDTGRCTGSIGVSTDISEQLRAREAADRLSAIVESSSDAILSKTLDGIIITFNGGAERLFGYAADEVLGRHVSILVPPGQEDEIEGLLERVRRGEHIQNVVTRRQRADGTILHVRLSVSPVLDASGEVVGAASIAQDLSEAVQLQERIESERARLADAQRTAHLGSFEVDLADGVFTCSEELYRIVGVDGTDHSMRLVDHVHDDDRAEVLEAVDEVIAGAAVARRTHRVVRPGGEVRWVETRMTPLREEGSSRISGVVLDITESHEAKQALVYQATHDRLTGLLNRAGMREELHRMVTDAPDASGHVAVALVDLDQFKVINDSFGHGFGDRVIEVVAARLVDALGSGHVVARFDGDEFMVARIGVEDLTAARALAERSQEVLSMPLTIDGRSVFLSASAGVAISERGSSAEALVRDADTAKFQAKEDGRACTRTFDSGARERAVRRLSIESGLRSALSNGELHLEYQPVVNLGDGRTAGFEALVRWTHPELGRVPPTEFIPIAEQAGLILPIGDWILGEALGQLASWRTDGRVAAETRLAVNLSAAQLNQPDLVERVADVISRTGVPPELIELEITETMLINRIEAAVEVVTAMRELGVRISIDDFGTGFSSLSYVDRLPIDVLKIDRSFVTPLEGDGDTSIVQAIAAIAESLGFDVIAEGIETPEQLAVLQRLGIGFGQGYLWTPPMQASEAQQWYAANQQLRARADGAGPEERSVPVGGDGLEIAARTLSGRDQGHGVSV